MTQLSDVYGKLLIVRPPVPATVNKAGANYKSEITHLAYSPRRAYDEWLSILDAIVACGGDALYQFEAADEPFLDNDALEVDGDGAIHPRGARETLGQIDEVMTGRVFAANGPWVSVRDRTLRAVMQNMLAHRRPEGAYYRALLGELATAGGLALELADNPHRWEGMADVAVVGDKVVLTYAVPGHYDHATAPKSSRSTRAGVAFAADFVEVPVRDNGCGMSRDFIDKSLFRPFQTTKKQGMGIGLYHCKTIVEAHGGRIEVESEEGRGTTFRVLLPV